MSLTASLLILILLCLASGITARWVIRSVTALGQAARLPEFVLGFVALGMATSFPELSVGINSATLGVPSLSFGNLVSGAIILLTFVAGMSAVINRTVKTSAVMSGSKIVGTGLIILSPLILALDGAVSRLDGAILIGFYAINAAWLINKTSRRTNAQTIGKRITIKNLVVFFTGLVLLFIFARSLVNVASDIANDLGLPPLIIGLLILGIGTNLPELTLLFTDHGRHRDLVLGDILGSASANAFIAGLVALIRPIVFQNRTPIYVSFAVLGLAVIIFILFSRTGRHLTRREGLLLIGLFVIFIILELYGAVIIS